MEIKDSFLEPEVRDGFYIPSVVKQAWAAEMEVLEVIDHICKKYDIPYFADWGTLLGTVRHAGFIPWDDDLDITMKRKDYMRFLEVAPKELPEGYELFTYANHPDFWHFLARVVGKSRICFEKEHLEQFHGFPYIVGVDVFVLDYVAVDTEKEEHRVKLAKYVIAVADEIAEGRLTGKAAQDALNDIEQLCKIRLSDRANLHELRVQLYRQAEQLFAMFSEEESTYLTRMMPDGLYGNKRLRLPKEYYDKAVWLPYENIKMPVPIAYDEMLRMRYGDYMKLVRNAGGHDYPFFEAQKKQLQAVLDFEMPGYRYKGCVKRQKTTGNTLKELVTKGSNQLEELLQQLRGVFEQNSEAEEILPLLQESQQLAIDMGMLIESCKGEGLNAVNRLEMYCELLFAFSQEKETETLEQLTQTLVDFKKCVGEDVLNRKEVVFLPYKVSQWEYIESVWQAAVDDLNCDVYVIPIPYFYKEYDGELRDLQYEGEQFPENVTIVPYDEFDFELHHPDTIIIQNAYDEYDAVISVHQYFYSANLKQLTDQLVYIPPFVVEEFGKDNYRENFNMQYYCTVPGVVNADKVIVQSENMKLRYVEKLTGFAGEETRVLWEQKLLGLGSPKFDKAANSALQLPENWQKMIRKADGSAKKIMMYYVGVSGFAQYGKQMLEKLRRVFAIFKAEKEDVAVIWVVSPLLKDTLEQMDEGLYDEYCIIEKEFKEQAFGMWANEWNDAIKEQESMVYICDAYYGDTSPLVQMFRNVGKPVMIQDAEC